MYSKYRLIDVLKVKIGTWSVSGVTFMFFRYRLTEVFLVQTYSCTADTNHSCNISTDLSTVLRHSIIHVLQVQTEWCTQGQNWFLTTPDQFYVQTIWRTSGTHWLKYSWYRLIHVLQIQINSYNMSTDLSIVLRYRIIQFLKVQTECWF